MLRLLSSVLVVSLSLVVGASTSSANPQEPGVGGEAAAKEPVMPAHVAFLEATGNWGVQIGQQSYLPNGTPGTSKAPLTNGFGFGATGGYAIAPDLEVIADYQHGNATSRSGDVTGALSSVDAGITYDVFSAGLRLGRETGPGRLYAQLGLGAMLPFSTVVTYDYAQPLSALGIMGTGTERSNYGMGYGAQAEFGYQVPIAARLYFAANLRLQAYQSSNDGQVTNLDNFVTNFEAPQPLTMDIHHGTSSAATPENYSVQDARFHLVLGYAF